MTPEHWRQIECLVEAALERDGARRRRFLDSACGGDADLRQAVDALLESFEQIETFLETPAVEHLDTSALVKASPQGRSNHGGAAAGGDRIGPYRILRPIGRGGMGTVYSAAREDHEFERRVAIKLIQPGMHSAGVARRFRSERQILANLDHPNIARLLDGGTAEGGRPYFVMELIEGTRIDEYCDARRLTVVQRLELFREVCAAVHYAHRNLVVHRDIKPSNILVTEDGVPKLLDFGIAKLLDPTDFPFPVEATRTGLRPMTPPYASPEQVRGEAITTASDVYSLGALLYELLTGQLPIAVGGLLPREIETALVEEQPVRPSTVLARPPAAKDETTALTVAALSDLRGTQPQQLRRQLAGDLDNIVLMALRKEPDRRYGSVEQLSVDLGRHLDGLPVSARRDTFGYRTGKFLRRNKLAASIAGSSLALVLGFSATVTVQAIQLARQRDRARRERDKAEKVAASLTDLFALADPDEAVGRTITARELLENGAEKIRQELADQPDVQASLMGAVGKIYRKLGLYDQAEPLLEQALEKRVELLGETHLEVADSLYDLARLDFEKGRYPKAARLFQSAMDIQKVALGPDHETLAKTTIHLAHTYFRHGERSRAELLYRHGLQILERASRSNDPLAGNALEGLGDFHFKSGDHKRAEALQRRAVEILERALPPDHPKLARQLIQLATIYTRSGRIDRAEALYRRGIESLEKVLGKNHSAVGFALGELGGHYVLRGDYDRAEPLYRQALETFERTVGEGHNDTAICRINLGICYSVTGQFHRAEALYRRALEITKEAVGHNRGVRASGLYKLAILYRRQGLADRAEPLFLQALRIFDELGQEDADAGTCLHNLARLYHDRRELAKAEPLYRRALAIRVRSFGDDHPHVANTLTELAGLRAEQGGWREGRELFERALAILERLSSQIPDDLQNQAGFAAVYKGLGDLFHSLGDENGASQAWQRAVALIEAVTPCSTLVEYRSLHCETLLRLGRTEEARPLAERLLETGWNTPSFRELCRDHGLGAVPEVGERGVGRRGRQK